MHNREQRILKEIQLKREKMIDCAQEHGLTNEKTIRYSQELDMLLNEYQRTFQSNPHPQHKKVKIPRKQMMLIWPKVLKKA